MTGFESLTYVQLNEQVTLQNQDPVDILSGIKTLGNCLGGPNVKPRVTRRKDNRDNVLSANFVKISTLNIETVTLLENLFGYVPAGFSYCSSIFKDKDGLLAFNLKIGKKFFDYCLKVFAKYVPPVARFSASDCFSSIIGSSKISHEGHHQELIGINNSKAADIVKLLPVFAWRKSLYANASFTINYTSKVCEQYLTCIFSVEQFKHLIPYLLVKRTINRHVVQRERLNPEDPKGYAIV